MIEGTDRLDRRPNLGAHRFSFAVITDTHLNQSEDDCNSPFAVNALANKRFRFVINDLNRRDLEFVVNVGDLLHPVPAVPELYDRAAAQYREQSASLRHRQYLTPGNHDVGDKPNDWAPTASVSDAFLAFWEGRFGPHYRSFDRGDCHFIIINAQLLNSGLQAEEDQRTWLESDLKSNNDRRLFLFTHYPPFLVDEQEPEHYDNLGEPARGWLIGLIRQYRVEALFAGHVHNFWFNRVGETDCYLLPSTAFVRQDYSEMYRSPPGAEDEAGRNDRPKLGYFVVDIHENGHVCHLVRTFGETAEDDRRPSNPKALQPAVHPKTNPFDGFGFDLRQDWMELVEIPPSGGLDEFDRKRVRNDYSLLGLWEMGIRRLRIPLADLAFTDRVNRLRELAEHGFAYTLFSFGAPDARARELIEDNSGILAAWEAGFDLAAPRKSLRDTVNLAGDLDLPLYVSRLRSHDELRAEAGQYFHVINHGFGENDGDLIDRILDTFTDEGPIAGFVFRLSAESPICETLNSIDALVDARDLDASVHLRTSGFNPAVPARDDLRIACRLAEALFVANALPRVHVFADTLMDHDRGYFVRHGAYDRLYNPRLASIAVKNLHAILGKYPRHYGAKPVVETGADISRVIHSAGVGGALQLCLLHSNSEGSAQIESETAQRLITDADLIRCPAEMIGPISIPFVSVSDRSD